MENIQYTLEYIVSHVVIFNILILLDIDVLRQLYTKIYCFNKLLDSRKTLQFLQNYYNIITPNKSISDELSKIHYVNIYNNNTHYNEITKIECNIPYDRFFLNSFRSYYEQYLIKYNGKIASYNKDLALDMAIITDDINVILFDTLIQNDIDIYDLFVRAVFHKSFNIINYICDMQFPPKKKYDRCILLIAGYRAILVEIEYVKN